MSAAGAIVDKFLTRIAQLSEYHRELLQTVAGKKRQIALEEMLSEQFVLNLAVLWEAFLSDLLIAYVVDDPKTTLKDLRERIGQSLKGNYGAEAESMTKFRMPRSLTRARARLLVDPKSFNVTAHSAEKLAERANKLLSGKYAKRFTLSAEDAQFFNYFVAVRNYLGHRSPASRQALKQTEKALTGKNAGLRGNLKNIGAYLRQTPTPGAERRSALVAGRVREITALLV